MPTLTVAVKYCQSMQRDRQPSGARHSKQKPRRHWKQSKAFRIHKKGERFERRKLKTRQLKTLLEKSGISVLLIPLLSIAFESDFRSLNRFLIPIL